MSFDRCSFTLRAGRLFFPADLETGTALIPGMVAIDAATKEGSFEPAAGDRLAGRVYGATLRYQQSGDLFSVDCTECDSGLSHIHLESVTAK